jgi:hypothetical protein
MPRRLLHHAKIPQYTKITLDLYGLTFATPDHSTYSIKELKTGKIEKKTLRKNMLFENISITRTFQLLFKLLFAIYLDVVEQLERVNRIRIILYLNFKA